MNEDKHKVHFGNLKKNTDKWQSGWVKPSNKWWKRYFNKKVRKGETYKKNSWWHWS